MNSLYDVYLGDISSLQPYRARSFLRDSAPQIATRFSTGSQGQSDLDLLKSFSLDNVSGGMFQKKFDLTTKVARAIGTYNKYDEHVYPAPLHPTAATAVSAGYYPVAKAESDNVSFIAYGAFAAGTFYNLLYMITYGGGYTNVVLPAALQNNFACNISGIYIHKKYLFVASTSSTGVANNHRYDIDAGTWQDVSGNSVKLCTLRNNLYGIYRDATIYSVTNETAAGAATYTSVTVAGSASINAFVTDMVEYNGAIYISKYDGIFRFDGVSATKILNLYAQQLCVFNGAMYFVAGMWLYKFDGVNVTRIQFFGSEEKVGSAYGASLGLSANSDFLFIATASISSNYVNEDKVGSVAAGLRRIYTYDGAAFMLWYETDVTFGTGYSPALVTNFNSLYDIFGNISGSWQTNWWKMDISALFGIAGASTTSLLEITSSEFDDQFPNIFKTFEMFELEYKNILAGDVITIKYQTYDGAVWSAWNTLGTITSTSSNRIEANPPNQKLFKRIKFNVSVVFAAGSDLVIKALSLRYTLQPRMRWRWQITLMASGNGATLDRAGAQITSDSNALNNAVTKSVKQKTPLFMLAPDYGIIKTTVNAAALSFIVPGQIATYTDPYNEYPLIAIKNASGVWEVLRVSNVVYNSGTDETTVTVLERGYYGVTAASLNAGAEVHIAYKVYVTRLLRDNTILDDNTYAEQSSGESQLQREFMLEITEV